MAKTLDASSKLAPARTPEEAARKLEEAGYRVAEPTTKRLPEPLRIKGLSRSLREVRR